MKRLLVYFSYIGTNYRGLQRKISNDPRRAPDLDTVQGILEFGLQKVFRSKTRISVFTSSRTDTGVHAVESTVQFDCDINKPGSDFPNGEAYAYSPEKICQSLNLFLEKNECDIRIKRVVEVDNTFSCRRAYSRVYENRIAVLNHEPYNVSSCTRLSPSTVITELNRCEVVHQPFDIQSVQNACKLFVGKWNFSTFMKSSRQEVELDKRLKTIYRFSLTPEVISWDDLDSQSDNLILPPYQIYVFTVEGSGFLRRQVRRMVGALVGVGRGTIGPSDVRWMLDNPSEQNWNPRVSGLGPSGLYLKQINYPQLNVLRGYLS